MTRTPTALPIPRESGLVQRMRKRVQSLPEQKPHVVVACSGGRDSVALAILVAEMARLGLVTASLAHVNHGIYSHAEEAVRAVDSLANTLGLDVDSLDLRSSDISQHQGVGEEEALRRARYQMLDGFVRFRNGNYLATAHHSRDQVESILLHLMRGSGLDGLSGMRQLSELPVPWWTDEPANVLRMWRPLLDESAEELAELVEQCGITVVEDPSNADTRFRRNAVRHELLPLMEFIAPGSEAAIARSASALAGDADALQWVTAQYLEQIREGSGLRRRDLRQLPGAMQIRVLRAWLHEEGAGDNLSFERLKVLQGLTNQARRDQAVQLKNGRSVSLNMGILSLEEPCDNNAIE